MNIVKNTVFLLFRLCFSMIANLLISRVALASLGVVDFGIYNVTSGVVIMLTLLTASFSSSISRFFNYEMGEGKSRLNSIFTISISFHVLLSVIIVLLGFVFGENVISNFLNIPLERQSSATFVLYVSVFSFVVSLLTVTFNALIISHEDIKVYSIIGVVDVALKLVGIYVITGISYDKLILYSLLLAFSLVQVFFATLLYCKVKYKHVHLSKKVKMKDVTDIFSFAGWNTIGASSSIMKEQGVTILINVFFDVTVNAARGISHQVNNALLSIVNNLMLAISPRITKFVAANQKRKALSLTMKSARYMSFFILLPSVVLTLETDVIIKFWLINPPEYVVVFVRLIVLNLVIDTLSIPLITLLLATGEIRNYQLIVGLVNGLNVPISYISFKLGMGVEYAYITSIAISFLCLNIRVVLLTKKFDVSLGCFYKEVVFRLVLTVLVSLSMAMSIKIATSGVTYLDGFFASLFFCVASTAVSIYIIGLLSNERKYINLRLKEKFIF